MVSDGGRPTRWSRAATRHPQVTDALFGVVLCGIFLIGVRIGPDGNAPRQWNRADVVTAGVALLLIMVRRWWPLPVLAAATAAAIVSLATVGSFRTAPLLAMVMVVCAYTVALRTGRTIGWLAGGAAGLALYGFGLRVSNHDWLEPGTVGILAWTGMAVAVGDALRTRRAYVAAVEERALRAEQSREQEARRQVTEERLRIARELHDVVAHHIAIINVQAGVAAHVLRRQPEQAEEALGHVRGAAHTVLDELSTVLGVLRRPDEPDTEPTRGLDRLSGLLEAFAAAGLRVEHRQDGIARPLPAAVDLAAFRIVQESLTNAQKYGNGTVHLCLAYGADDLTIEVWNRMDQPRADDDIRGGHGLIGMRERAGAVGGTLHAARTDGGRFTVRAVLPSVGRPPAGLRQDAA